MVPLTIAPHLREKIFRLYEPLLERAVASWPTESSFTIPPDIASATFLANFRNAIVSLVNYDWPTTVNRAKLIKMREERAYVINFGDGGLLHFRAPHSVGRKPLISTSRQESSIPSRVAESPTSAAPWRDWTEAELEALVLLIDKQRINGPVYLDGEVKSHLVEHYHSIFNVALVYDETRKLTIIT